jgi:sulfide:quinone oxidoreductase
VAQTRLGERLPYDSLIIASGTRLRVAVPGAITAWGHTERGTPGTLIPELLLGDIASLAFCVPGGDPWPLPVYELAILTARRLSAAARGDAELVVVTPESVPGEGLGPEASEALLAVLEEAGIGLVPGRVPLRFESGTLLTTSEAVSADRAVAPPRHDGCYLAELPLDDEGFIPADELGRVAGADGVHAAGEVTSFPLRHAAIAAEQARAAAEAVALRAGAVLSPTPWRATISGRLLACPLTRRLSGTSGLWWPPDVLAAPELRAYLAERVGFRPTLPEGGVPVELALEPRPPLSPPAVPPVPEATAAPPA